MMIRHIFFVLISGVVAASAAPFPVSSVFVSENTQGMSWAMENSGSGAIVHSAVHDPGNNSLRYARIQQNLANVTFEYFGSSEVPLQVAFPEISTSIAIGDNGGVAVAYTTFESLPQPGYHLYIAKKNPGGSWQTQKLREFVSINRIELALRNGDINEWRIVYSNPSVAEIRIISAEGNDFKLCDLVFPASEVGFDIIYDGPQGFVAYHDPVAQKLLYGSIIDNASGAGNVVPDEVDAGPGVGLDVQFAHDALQVQQRSQ